MIKTSFYGNKSLNQDMKLIRISRSIPNWFKLKVVNGESLYPSWELLNGYKSGKINQNQYIEIYNQQLSLLDIDYIYQKIGETGVLLCWENPENFCHRRLVANWLEKVTGYKITEI